MRLAWHEGRAGMETPGSLITDFDRFFGHVSRRSWATWGHNMQHTMQHHACTEDGQVSLNILHQELHACTQLMVWAMGAGSGSSMLLTPLPCRLCVESSAAQWPQCRSGSRLQGYGLRQLFALCRFRTAHRTALIRWCCGFEWAHTAQYAAHQGGTVAAARSTSGMGDLQDILSSS